SPDFELFAALFIYMRGTVHGEALDAGGERNGAPHLRAGALRRVHDFPRRVIENAVIEGLQPDPDVLTLHLVIPSTPQSKLFDDLGHDAGADRAAAFTDSEAQLLFHGDRDDQFDFDGDVIARHHHFRAFRQLHDAGHVGGAEIELRTIIREE